VFYKLQINLKNENKAYIITHRRTENHTNMFSPPPPQPNYYEILGVSPQASPQEIKANYRKLSFKFHPDKNKDSGAQETFQAISSAYEILSDPQKRQQYDFERENPYGGGGGGGGFTGGDLNDILNMMFGGGMRHHAGFSGPTGFPGSTGFPGPGIHVFNMSSGPPPPGGGPRFATMNFAGPQQGMPHPIFEELFGGGVGGGGGGGVPPPPPLTKEITLTLEQCYSGCSMPVELARRIDGGDTELETIYINVPHGIDNNETIVISGKGNVQGSIQGDLKVVVSILPHVRFERSGLDICMKKTVTLKEALLGATISFQHLNGKNYNLTSAPEIITPGMRRRFQGLGMMRGEHHGDFWLEFGVEFPVTLTPEQREALILGL
jgi:molecular chaperone DnaJ